MATYEVRLPTGHVVTRTVPDGASDEVVRKVFADEMRRAGINVNEQQVVRRKTLGEFVNENKKPTLKDGFQGEITTPQRNVSGRVSDYINAALVEAGVDERYAAHLSNRVESFLGDLTPTGNLDGLLYGHSDLERQLSILPIPGPERKAIIKGIRAWHGSPHDFEKFSLSKIGTGEGAQAYGHGLYFAENPKVAEDYRRSLAGYPAATFEGKPIPANLNTITPEVRNWLGEQFGKLKVNKAGGLGLSDEEVSRAVDAIGPLSLRHAFARASTAAHAGDDVAAELARFAEQAEAAGARQAFGMDKAEGLTQARVAQALAEHGGVGVNRPGRLYEVNINAKPEDFLNWDAPLNAQSPKIQSAFDALAHPEFKARRQAQIANGDLTGAGVMYSPLGMDSRNAARASEAWRGAGIPGIRYLDQGSRGAANGTRNYVVFDDSLIDILNKY